VNLDPDRLGQIIANLVENALKYATAVVEVSAARHDQELTLVVTDDGPGISADDAGKVFTRLYTARARPAGPSGRAWARDRAESSRPGDGRPRRRAEIAPTPDGCRVSVSRCTGSRNERRLGGSPSSASTVR
jgi:hypothetical protein